MVQHRLATSGVSQWSTWVFPTAHTPPTCTQACLTSSLSHVMLRGETCWRCPVWGASREAVWGEPSLWPAFSGAAALFSSSPWQCPHKAGEDETTAIKIITGFRWRWNGIETDVPWCCVWMQNALALWIIIWSEWLERSGYWSKRTNWGTEMCVRKHSYANVLHLCVNIYIWLHDHYKRVRGPETETISNSLSGIRLSEIPMSHSTSLQQQSLASHSPSCREGPSTRLIPDASL